jgi:beta-galactosidase/beta-glucuronidase
MKRIFFTLGILSILVLNAAAQWAPAGDRIKTRWADEVNPNNVLPEYPRPLMERREWLNLNGLWDYAVKPLGEREPAQFDGQILVPFAIESSLSGVMRRVSDKEELWYRRNFTIPASWRGRNVLLQFGAVDWKADVFVNDIKVGSHTGGYTPFTFDITPFLQGNGVQKLVVKVWDGTDTDFQPRGKQVNNPHGIWYTPVTGIWQTVWLEPVNNQHIANVRSVPNIDINRMTVNVCTRNTLPTDIVEVRIREGNTLVATSRTIAGQAHEIHIPNAKLWSPDSPFLYDMDVTLSRSGRVVDQIVSYCAMRKISMQRDGNGVIRFQLNNQNLFHYGLLDQGWWPDGLYTAPTDEALAYDIVKTKDFGYNMIRKHVKVEPARWYTHADRLGVLVWQDMPNGGHSPQWQMNNYFTGQEFVRSAESEANYRKEWKSIMDLLYSHPSVVVWVPFNEAWGQFKTVEISQWTKDYDPSRLVLPASGGNHYRTGDILGLHRYPAPELYLVDYDRAVVLSEYGGIGLPLEGHLWQTDRNWGYVQFRTSKETTDEYIRFAERLKLLTRARFTGAVYTQTTDVEGEVNGIMTYDRKVIKLEEDRLRQINLEVIKSMNE